MQRVNWLVVLGAVTATLVSATGCDSGSEAEAGNGPDGELQADAGGGNGGGGGDDDDDDDNGNGESDADVSAVAIFGPDKLMVGTKWPMQAIPRTLDATYLAGRTIVWTSSDAAVAEIDASTGILTARTAGKVKITARVGSATRDVELTIVGDAGIEPRLWASPEYGTSRSCVLARSAVAYCQGRIGTTTGARTEATYTSPDWVEVQGELAQVVLDSPIADLIIESSGAYFLVRDTSGKLFRAGRVAGGPIALDPFLKPYLPELAFRSVSAELDGVRSAAVSTTGDLYTWGARGPALARTISGDYAEEPAIVPDGRKYKLVTHGPQRLLALTESGQIYVWGTRDYYDTSTTPKLITSAQTFDKAALGTWAGYAITADGDGYAWGTNADTGALGIGTPAAATIMTPTLIAGGHKWKRIVPARVRAGGIPADFAIGITVDHHLFFWGTRQDGEVSFVPVAIAPNRTFYDADATAGEEGAVWGLPADGSDAVTWSSTDTLTTTSPVPYNPSQYVGSQKELIEVPLGGTGEGVFLLRQKASAFNEWGPSPYLGGLSLVGTSRSGNVTAKFGPFSQGQAIVTVDVTATTSASQTQTSSVVSVRDVGKRLVTTGTTIDGEEIKQLLVKLVTPPPPDPGTGGGGTCPAYVGTTDDPQFDSFCQSAWNYGCQKNEPGRVASCKVWKQIKADNPSINKTCTYCNGVSYP